MCSVQALETGLFMMAMSEPTVSNPYIGKSGTDSDIGCVLE